MKLLVIGYTGLVGSRFCELAKKDFKITGIDEKILDITNQSAVQDFFSKNSFDAVINLSAYTDVAGAEAQWNKKEGLCYRLNTLAPGYLAEEAKKYNIFFVHFSTDFVFEGLEDSKGPFEEDRILPENSDNLCWYGWTKNRGEVEVANRGDHFAVVRIANPFRSEFPGKLDFARKLLDLYDKKSLFPLFTDQIITPVFVDDLINPLTKIVKDGLEGNFHLVSSDTCSYYDFGNYLLEKARGVKNFPEKASLTEFLKNPERNKRPIFGGLATEKTQSELGMKFKTWREMVDEFTSTV